jgi:predicted helicase
VNRIGLHDLENANVDWEKLAAGLSGELARSDKKTPRPHQIKAIAAAHEHFQTTGPRQTHHGLRHRQNLHFPQNSRTGNRRRRHSSFPRALHRLVGANLNEWTGDAENPFNAICICSDAGASKKRIKNDDSDGYSVVDLALPASTDIRAIVQQFEALKVTPSHPLSVVFSTYQSIEVIAEAQKALRGIHPVGL